MRTVDLIIKKKRGGELSAEELRYLVEGFVGGTVPDYQMSSFLMAVCFRGMSDAETVALTQSMLESGGSVDLEGVLGVKVDKHSTGGVGDKTTLVLAPLLASCGLVVAKMSGRGLGHTGGTLDKLESLEGFRVDLSRAEFLRTVNEHGMAVVSQSVDLVPADKKMYLLRDVTGTVDNVSLIAASIMSKKLAIANDALVLDVKVGSGAFMKTMPEAVDLATSMVRIGKAVGRNVRAVITEMGQPLGEAIGNALEVEEAIATLKGQGPPDLEDVVTALAVQLLTMTGKARSEVDAKKIIRERISSGAAFERFTRFVQAQGGKPGSWDRLPRAMHVDRYTAPKGGILASMNCEEIGLAAMKLGAGRKTKDSALDLSAGLKVLVEIGQPISPGDVLCELHHNSPEKLRIAMVGLERAFVITPPGTDLQPTPYVHRVITA